MANNNDIDFDEEAVIKNHVRKFLLYPEFWSEPNNRLNFTPNWKKVAFNRSNISKISKSIGVYAFVVKPSYQWLFNTSYLFYVGKTTRPLQTRFTEYIEEQEGIRKSRMKVLKMLRLYKGHLYFWFCELPDKTTVGTVENILINTFVPQVNVQIEKAKIKRELQYVYE
jgi:hypothetical protein